jgi:hypothetical protein
MWQQEIWHESFYSTVWLQIRCLMGGTLMYERETDEATRKVVSCCHVNVCSSPHHNQHTPCVMSSQYAQNLTLMINMILRNLYNMLASIRSIIYKYILTVCHFILLHAPAHWWRSENYASGGRKYKYLIPRQLKNKLSKVNEYSTAVFACG